MHNVIVDHEWLEVNRVDFGLSAEDVTMRCAYCGAERHILHTNASDETYQNQETEEEAREALKGISESLKQFSKTMNLYIREMLDGSKYVTSQALMDDIAKRYNGNIEGKDLPFRWLGPWTATNYRKAQRKFLLFYKQGPVCNRCDLIFSIDELTEDHIEGDRSRGRLTDLQLLCKNCGGKKGNDPPTELDISPFKFEGESCIHRVACTELDAV